MRVSTYPVLSVELGPRFDSAGIHRLDVTLRVQDREWPAKCPMFMMNVFQDNIPGPGYTSEDIMAMDDNGPLELEFSNIPTSSRNTQQHWSPCRATRGDVVLSFHVAPRDVDSSTPVGARIDLRRDGVGLQGAGQWFLPRLLSDEIWTNTVRWNLRTSSTPSNTRCAWSFGDGEQPRPKTGRTEVLWRTVYMVGPFNSYPEKQQSPRSGNHARVYWFGHLPANLDAAKDFNVRLHARMTEHFGVTNESYRVFIRRVPRVMGGTGFLSSYVLDYDDKAKTQPQEAVVNLFAHEMVHSFVQLDAEMEGYDNAWFTEGIAELYSSLLPYRFGLCGLDYMINTINGHVRAYFTSPRIAMDIRDAGHAFFSDWYAMWVPYKRGAAYLIFIDCLLRQRHRTYDLNINSPLDDIVIEIARRNRSGLKTRGKEWLALLEAALDKPDFPTETHFHGMLRGDVMSFQDIFLGSPSMPFVRQDLGVMEFGFDFKSLEKRVISGLLHGSAAERAGVRNDCQILSAFDHNLCTNDARLLYKIHLQDDQQDFEVKYMPRTQWKTVCWALC